MIRTIINGLCMSLADSVPGVSGGTVAFIMGFYEKFIGSINDIFYGDKAKKKEAAFYLIKIGIGWAIGMIVSVIVLTSMFEKHIYSISSLFMGFIIASIPIMIMEELKDESGKERLRFKPFYMIFIGIGIATVVLLTILKNNSGDTIIMSVSHLNVGSIIYIFIGGAISISAMFLPGISGSTILLVMGLYIPVMTAGKEFLHAHISYLPSLLIFAGGMIAGALSVVKLIEFCFEKYRHQVMLLIIGLMIGSLFAIVMGPTTLENPEPPLSLGTFNWVAFFIGVGLIVLLQFVGERKKRETKV